MPYEPSTDFVGLWRAVLGGVEKSELPGLDFVVAALGRAGIIRVVFSEVAPTVNQSTTAWFRTAHPSYAAEGALYLWDQRLGTYVPATPELFLIYIMAATDDDLLAIWAVMGIPTDDIGKDGDYAIRLDAPGGIYGPKAGGHWPAQPIPGTSYIQISAFLDWLGSTQGEIVYRGSTAWTVLQPGTVGQVLKTGGPSANPSWGSAAVTSPDFDILFGGVQGSVIYRGLSVWSSLPPTTNGFVLTTHGAAANPSWVSVSGPGGIFDLNFPGATQGSIIYRGATQWTFLGPGAANQLLMSNGAGANVSWGTVAGPTGPAGPAGPTGATGATGATGPPGTAGGGGTVNNGRLAYAGDGAPPMAVTGTVYEPFPGAVLSGFIADTPSTYIYRWRYLQMFTTGWFTIAYA